MPVKLSEALRGMKADYGHAVAYDALADAAAALERKVEALCKEFAVLEERIFQLERPPRKGGCNHIIPCSPGVGCFKGTTTNTTAPAPPPVKDGGWRDPLESIKPKRPAPPEATEPQGWKAREGQAAVDIGIPLDKCWFPAVEIHPLAERYWRCGKCARTADAIGIHEDAKSDGIYCPGGDWSEVLTISGGAKP